VFCLNFCLNYEINDFYDHYEIMLQFVKGFVCWVMPIFDIMKTGPRLLFMIVLAFVIEACHKHSNPTITGGGKGGNETIQITPEHEGYFIDTGMVYIKYGAVNAPNNGVYDDSDSVSMINNKPMAVFTHLTVGNYFFRATGYHGGLTPSPYVQGGYPFTAYKESTDSIIMSVGEYNP